MTVTLSCLYDDYETAKQVVRDLESAGLPSENISIVAKDRSRRIERDGRVDRDADGRDDRAEGAEIGAGIGAVLGGTAGLLTGLGMLAIPGIGPVVAAGWLVATGAGVLAGGAAGGIIGALTQLGVSRNTPMSMPKASAVARHSSPRACPMPSAVATRRSWIATPSTSTSAAPHFVAPVGRSSTRELLPTLEMIPVWPAKTRVCAVWSPICRWKTKR